MDEFQQRPKRRLNPRLVGAVGLVAAGAIVGGVFAGSLSANAATGASTSATGSSSSPGGAAADRHGPNTVRSGETVVTGTALSAATLKAAALKAVPGGSVYRIETDADGAAYEAHMTKADGTEVTVKFDKSLAVTAVQDGMGAHK